MFSNKRTLVISLFIILTCFFSSPAYADGTHPQGIRLDGTIGTAGKIDLAGPDYQIKPEYGKQAGSNLFHSFQQFNIHSGESATFSGPASVQNIISRITGGSASWIDGRLASTIPGADLYFLNPSGVMFGSNASLDLSGSFHVSTADYLRMGENERFYSKPIENEVLSVAAPTAFGFLSDNPAKISVEGKGYIAPEEYNGKAVGLKVSEGKTISLIGGDIEIKGGFYEDENRIFPIGSIYAPGGRINIAGVSSAGEVVPTVNDLNVSSPQKGNLTFSDKSVINVNGLGDGSIFIRGGQFVAKDSFIEANTNGRIIDIQADNISFKNGAHIDAIGYSIKGGYITLKASESVSFGGECCSAIWIAEYGGGGIGKLAIDAKNIFFADGSYIYGGDVMLKASELVSFAGSNMGVSMIGLGIVTERDLGNLLIDAKNISFTNGAYISSNTESYGKGGEVTLKAAESVSFAGESSKAETGGIFINTSGAGDAGKLTIDAKNISFADGTDIKSNAYSKGKGGEITLKAAESVSFSGENSKAAASNIGIATYSKEEAAGNAGKLSVNAKNISFTDGAYINASTYGKGIGGEVSLKATESVFFSGENSNALCGGIGIITTDTETGAGDAGKLTIDAKNISFMKGTTISSNTKGKGKGGEISLKATESVFFSGENSKAMNSGIEMMTVYSEEGAGDAGTLTIDAKNISFADGAYINSNTEGKGKGGEVTLKAAESVSFSGENSNAAISSVIGITTTDKEEGAGDAGKLMIDAQNISFTSGAGIGSDTYGKGKGGDVFLKASKSISFSGESSKASDSVIRTQTYYAENGAGDAGKVILEAKDISFTGGAFITASSHGRGKGGEVILQASGSVSFSGEDSKAGQSAIEVGAYYTGDGAGDSGSIMIQAKDIFFTNGATIDSSTDGKGKGGEVSLNASESVSFSGENSKANSSGIGIGTTDTGEGAGDAGKLLIEAKNISFTGGTGITSDTQGKGKGGEVTLKASESVSFSGENSKANSSGIGIGTFDSEEGAGDAGKLTIDAKNISFTGGTVISSNTKGKGKGGEITLKAAESVSFSGENSKANSSGIGIGTFDSGGGAGDAGKLLIEAKRISFTGGVGIDSHTEGKGKGGEVTLKASEAVSFSGENSKAAVSRIRIVTTDTGEGAGDAGKLSIDAKNISFTDGALIDSSTLGKGKGGEVTLKASEAVSFSGENSKAAVSGITVETKNIEESAGDAGKLSIEAKNISYTGGTVISSNTLGKGKGGEVTLKASETVSFSGEDSNAIVSRILINTRYKEEDAGDAGKLTIEAKNISFTDGAVISSDTLGKGKGGEVTLKASETISFAGENSKAETSVIWIGTTDTGGGAGDAGKLTINAKKFYFTDGAGINSGTFGRGKGGEVTLNAAETITLSGVSSKGDGSFVYAGSYNIDGIIGNTGPGGKISVSAQKLQISDKGQINTSSDGGEQAGDISLNVGNLELSGGASVSSDADKSGGGRISIDAKDTVSLTDSSITTNVAQGTGKGGDITIGNPDTGAGSQFVILNHSQIQANATEGDGGAVFVITDNFLKSFGSIVEASSARGNNGTVKIEAPDLDISGGLTILPGIFFDASKWASTPCEARSGEAESRFEVRTHILQPVPFEEQP